MTLQSTNPTLSIALLAYNSSEFIEEALRSVLAQTYRPLQIIISDDCSRDDTFERINAIAGAYRGSASVVLNRNPVNLGIGAHVGVVASLAVGEYLVLAAGDDVSAPNRVRSIALAAFAEEFPPAAIFSASEEIDAMGSTIGSYGMTQVDWSNDPMTIAKSMMSGVTGATAAWHRNVFSRFPAIPRAITFEDRVLTFRASLIGKIVFIDEPLVRYRRHSNNTVAMFQDDSVEKKRRRLECFLEVYRNAQTDLEMMKGPVDWPPMYLRRLRTQLTRETKKLEGYLAILSDDEMIRLSGVVSVILNGGSPSASIRTWLIRRIANKDNRSSA